MHPYLFLRFHFPFFFVLFLFFQDHHLLQEERSGSSYAIIHQHPDNQTNRPTATNGIEEYQRLRYKYLHQPAVCKRKLDRWLKKHGGDCGAGERAHLHRKSDFLWDEIELRVWLGGDNGGWKETCGMGCEKCDGRGCK